ncbi:MAG: PQQ-binding-like beta-propeller repeat protein [Acidobacteriota bacterium]|nr:PQQ-binding-like beta-propeller repeat protein [Acidobacteriota bacterium]
MESYFILTIDELVFVGIHGSVVALGRTLGEEIWRTPLKGSDFVNLTLDGDRLLATTKGEVFCLDGLTGSVLWSNELPGMGRGVMSVVTVLSCSSAVASVREHQRRKEDAANAAVIGSTVAVSH